MAPLANSTSALPSPQPVHLPDRHQRGGAQAGCSAGGAAWHPVTPATTTIIEKKSNRAVALGVGLGIGLGVPAVAAAAAYFFWWKPARAAASGLSAPML